MPLSGEDRPSKGISIYVSTDKWNDFGHRTQFFFDVLNDSELIKRPFRLAFLGTEEQPATVIRNAMESTRKLHVAADTLPQFFSLQHGMNEYRELVSALGSEKATTILLSINDLVAVRRLSPTPSWVEEATKSEIFTHSLVRNSEAFFAYYNAKSILSGLTEENLHVISKEIDLTFKLNGFKNEHNFHFKFDTKSLIPKRISVLIGKNGVGKSRALHEIVRASIDGTDSLTNTLGERPQISRIIAICTPGETEATFPSVPIQGARINYVRLSAAPGERADGGDGQTLPEVILQLARNYDSIKDVYRWEIFEEAISKILPFESLRIIPPLRPLKDEISSQVMKVMGAVDIIDLRRGGEQRCLDAALRLDHSGDLVRQIEGESVPLSSGQLSFIRLAAQLCLHIENGSLLLIDEPETHLHPNLITDLVAMLNRILELSGSVAIVATHSAYLVREVPGSQVHVIRENAERLIEVVQPRLKTFGADVGSISNFVFGDDIVNRLITEIEERIQASPKRHANWKDDLRRELSTEALIFLEREIGNKKGRNQ
jgi:predicted ATPase